MKITEGLILETVEKIRVMNETKQIPINNLTGKLDQAIFTKCEVAFRNKLKKGLSQPLVVVPPKPIVV